jgi:threonine dehydrogenase-like Zn-dependent dehydrogenase
VAGHEAAGEVVALGAGVASLKVGARVAVHNVISCGRCADCRAGRFVRCANWSGANVNHGFCEFLVAPERNCLTLDARLDYEAGCLILDNWGTPFVALNRGSVTAADQVVVIGAGPIGLGAVVLAKLRGAFVIVVEALPYRCAAAKRLGADAALESSAATAAAIKELTGGLGPSVVLDCSGQGPAYALGLAALRISGRFVCVGEHAEYLLRPSDYVIRRHLDIRGTWYSTMSEGAEVQELMLSRRIEPSCFVTHRVAFDDLPAAFARTCACRDDTLKTVLLIPPRSP